MVLGDVGFLGDFSLPNAVETNLVKIDLTPDFSVNVVQNKESLDRPEDVDPKSGALVWEGGLDLARHLARVSVEELDSRPSKEERFTVLELGAGHGVPGLVVGCRLPSADLHLHDLSPQVLESVTAPNAQANGLFFSSQPEASEGSVGQKARCRFVAGDWKQLVSAINEQGLKYDLILASEVIYKVDMYTDLKLVLEQGLRSGGRALFSGKRFYFGCGGGTASFAAFLRNDGFVADIVQPIEDGRSNVREILQIRRGQPGDAKASNGSGKRASNNGPEEQRDSKVRRRSSPEDSEDSEEFSDDS